MLADCHKSHIYHTLLRPGLTKPFLEPFGSWQSPPPITPFGSGYDVCGVARLKGLSGQSGWGLELTCCHLSATKFHLVEHERRFRNGLLGPGE
jgi:hypothetical protein